jgi:hypothetical protein
MVMENVQLSYTAFHLEDYWYVYWKRPTSNIEHDKQNF